MLSTYFFKYSLWVFSGRRGVHAWVSDDAARKLDDSQRSSIITYLSVIGKASLGKQVSLARPFHPHIARSFEILKQQFEPVVLVGQDPWRSASNAEKLLQRLAPSDLVESLRKLWGEREVASIQRWRDIDEATRRLGRENAGAIALQAKQDVIFEYLYPRPDTEVSKKLIHLLKAPFVVHPGTNKVCVPIDISRLQSFDIEKVPKLGALIEEFNQFSGDKKAAIDGSSLSPYREYLKKYVESILPKKRPLQEGLDF